jgi:hypothetical protein
VEGAARVVLELELVLVLEAMDWRVRVGSLAVFEYEYEYEGGKARSGSTESRPTPPESTPGGASVLTSRMRSSQSPVPRCQISPPPPGVEGAARVVLELEAMGWRVRVGSLAVFEYEYRPAG